MKASKMGLSVEHLHITESLTRLGGVETLVKQLVSGSADNHAAALLDPPSTGVERGIGLRSGKHAGSFLVRRAARAAFSHARHLVFHNFAGMMMLSGGIPHDRKTLFLHTNSPDVFELLPQRLPYLDAILVSGSALETEIRERHPAIRIPVTAVEYPLDDRYFNIPLHLSGDSLVLGYCGRLEHEQKQVLRLAELCEALVAYAVDFTLEIAGTGSAMEELRERLPQNQCRFLGALDATRLATAYQRWDFLVCTSDYETGPLVAMEAMAAGVIPIMPDIPCQATAMLADLKLLLYPRGEMRIAASQISQISQSGDLDLLRAALREKVADRRLGRFVSKIDGELAAVAARPALAATPLIPRGFAEWLPFSLRRSGNDHLR